MRNRLVVWFASVLVLSSLGAACSDTTQSAETEPVVSNGVELTTITPTVTR